MTLLVAGGLSLACVSSAAHTDGGQALSSRAREGGTGDVEAAPLSGEAGAGVDGGAPANDADGSADFDASAPVADASGDVNAGNEGTIDAEAPDALDDADAAEASDPSACVLGASTLGACFLP
jgi:hypothetical protein